MPHRIHAFLDAAVAFVAANDMTLISRITGIDASGKPRVAGAQVKLTIKW